MVTFQGRPTLIESGVARTASQPLPPMGTEVLYDVWKTDDIQPIPEPFEGHAFATNFKDRFLFEFGVLNPNKNGRSNEYVNIMYKWDPSKAEWSTHHIFNWEAKSPLVLRNTLSQGYRGLTV